MVWCKNITVGTRAGFQSFLRRSEGGGRAEDGASDADWSSGGGGVFYCYFPPTPHGTFITHSLLLQGKAICNIDCPSGMVNSMVAEELMRRGLHINCLPVEILIKGSSGRVLRILEIPAAANVFQT